jgi:vanillate O-demethylase ferredoxin subunit
MRLNVRKLLLSLHLWTGLTIGLLLMVTAATGSLMVFRHQLEPRFDRRMFVVEPGPARLAPDDLVARARAAHPAGEFENIRYSGVPTAPFMVYFTNKDFVHLNPYTGEVLGVRARYGSLFGWIEGMHKFLQLEPAVGEPITGYTALVFGFIILSGLVLWWPASRRALKAGLTLNRKLKGRPWDLNLHKVLGAYAALVLLFSVSTGVPISLDWAKDALYPLTGSKKSAPPVAPATAHGAFAGFTAAAHSVATVYPEAAEVYIPLPKKGLVTAYVIEPGASHPNARSYVWLEPSTAKVIQARSYAQAAAGFRLYYWMMSLHTGAVGGPAWQIILLLGALSLLVLGYTGTASYLRRKFGRPAVPPTKAMVLAPVKSA